MMNQTKRPCVWHIGGDDIHKRIPLLQALRERGFDVAAVGSEAEDDFRDQNVPYFRYTLKRKLTPLSDIRSCRELSTLFRVRQPDVVHGFDPKPAIAAPILAKRIGVPGRVRTITGLGFVMASNSPLARALRPVYRHLQRKASESSFTIFQNGDDREYFLQHGLVGESRQELVLGSGIDVERLRAERPDGDRLSELRNSLGLENRTVVTMVSRIDKNKGVCEFCDAARALHRQHSKTVFLLVGPYASEGKQAEQLVEEIRRESSYLRYLGPRKDIAALLALSDVFALPSYREGLPRVLVEAGAMEVPAVATDVPGCREVIRDGWNGRLVPPRDGQALAGAIGELLRDRRTRLKMGRRGYVYVKEKFDLAYVADAYAAIYRRALSQPC